MKFDLDYVRKLFNNEKLSFENPEREGSSKIFDLFLDTFDYEGSVAGIFNAFHPSFSSDDGPSKMAIWFDAKGREAGEKKRQKGKPGKMFKRMFPDATPREVAKFAEAYAEAFCQSNLNLNISELPEDFKRAYSHNVACSGTTPDTGDFRKSLYDSCMQHSNSSFDIPLDIPHFAESYASGDFKIIWCDDENGEIHSRCVVYKKTEHMDGWLAGPIYGVSENAIDHIERYFVANDIQHGDWFSWEGAKFNLIEFGEDFIIPYIDFASEYMSLSKNEGYLTLVNNVKEAEFQSGNCHARAKKIHRCSFCKTGFAESSYTYNDQHHCYSCFHDCYKYCNVNHTYYPIDEMKSARVYNHWDEREICHVHKSIFNEHTVMFEGQIWMKNQFVITECGKYMFKYKGGWFRSDLTQKIYLSEHRISIHIDCWNTVCATKEELEESKEYVFENGQWNKIDVEPQIKFSPDGKFTTTVEWSQGRQYHFTNEAETILQRIVSGN